MTRFCCLPEALEPVASPAALKPSVEDYKLKTRDAMIAKMGGMGSNEKTGDLDDLIKNRNDDDMSVEEMIHNNKKLDTIIAAARIFIKKNDRLISNCEKHRWESEGGFTYQRVEINEVKVESNGVNASLSRILLKTTPRRKIKDFGLPPAIPATLVDIIAAKDGIAGLPDYELFLERALLLQNDVLKPFLQLFQSHLLNIEAFFREVAAWIAAPDADRAFLEHTFQVDFDISMPSNNMNKETEDDVTESCTSGDESSEDGNAITVRTGNLELPLYSKVRRAIVDQEILLKEYISEGSYELSFSIEYGHKEKMVKFIEYLEN
jgi:hypothetical protein